MYPSGKSDKLRHTTWTGEGGWSTGEELDGHDSKHTPALLVTASGPTDTTEALLLVRRGVFRFIEPQEIPEPVEEPKPTPSTMNDVVSRGEKVTGTRVTDYGNNAWSRVTHQVSLTPATLKNGDRALIVGWDATAEYYWGSAHYRDGSGTTIQGTLWLNREGSNLFLESRDFHLATDASGNLHYEALIPDPEPGTYILTNSNTNTIKTGGYWKGNDATFNYDDDNDSNFWSRVECSKASVSVTI